VGDRPGDRPFHDELHTRHSPVLYGYPYDRVFSGRELIRTSYYCRHFRAPAKIGCHTHDGMQHHSHSTRKTISTHDISLSTRVVIVITTFIIAGYKGMFQ